MLISFPNKAVSGNFLKSHCLYFKFNNFIGCHCNTVLPIIHHVNSDKINYLIFAFIMGFLILLNRKLVKFSTASINSR